MVGSDDLSGRGVEQVRERLRHICWIGGGTGAGKSTVAARIAQRYGLEFYSTDDAMSDHVRRSRPEETPYLQRFAAMDMDERWVDRSPATMLETFHWYRGEGFGLIVEDLLRSPPDRGVVVEGFRLLPELVAPLLADPRRAVWLLPTPEFRRAAFESRGGLWKIAGRTGNPERALHNLLERDRMFTERLEVTATGLGLPVIRVDSTLTEDELVTRVVDSFAW